MKQILRKTLSIFLALAILFQCFFSNRAYALTGGPSSPEFSSFEPVATTNMVNEFTGDFVYNLPVLNVPGPNGSGYAVSLSYHAGTTPEEEASWVGYGWTLNPGAINRGKKGFADDVNGSKVTYSNKMKRNYTNEFGIFTGGGWASLQGQVSFNTRYNNYKGFGGGVGFSTGAVGVSFGIDYDVTNETSSYSVSLSVSNMIQSIVGMAGKQGDNSTAKAAEPKYNKWAKMGMDKIPTVKERLMSMASSLSTIKLSSKYGMFGSEFVSHATQVPEYSGSCMQFTSVVSGSYAGATFSVGYNTSYTYQNTTPSTERNSYGYLYSHNATAEEAMQDYFTDKNMPHQKDDHFLPMPISNPDMFMVAGEGLGGSFRFYNKNTAQFRPALTTSKTSIRHGGNSFNIGGMPWEQTDGGGSATNTIGKWDNIDAGNTISYSYGDQEGVALNDYAFNSSDDEAYFARFDNDLGGNINFIDNEGAYAASLKQLEGTPDYDMSSGFGLSTQGDNNAGYLQHNDNKDHESESAFGMGQVFSPDISTTDFPKSMELNSNGRISRSSYIGYHTNKQINAGVGHNISDNFKNFIDRSTHHISDGIGEIVTYNEAGLRYNYGLPVYARNEVNMRYGLSKSDVAENNYLVYKDVSLTGDIDMMAGETSNTPYATTYLLTDITTPDYIDRTLDGPTKDDFGGYTKFNYTQTYGSKIKDCANDATYSTNWYKWRVPYDGLLYDRGELSTSMDDAGYVMYGEKEMYFLESIETRTHIAKFILSDRLDGIEAAKNETAAKGGVSLSGLKKSKKLDRIELYTKDANGNADKLIQTVNFSYDYSLMRGLPNSTGSSAADVALDKADGRLTLKKLWFNYQGIYNAKISPYEFTYAYKALTDFSSQIQYKYSSIVNYGENIEQNPNYASCNIDPWGNYQEHGAERLSLMKKWVAQSKTSTSTFDPAAWQLKQIKLPSGGEILVQYEQNDYQYVQNFPAFSMVKLKSQDGDPNSLYQSETSETYNYYLNTADIGISDANPLYNDDLKALKEYLYQYFMKNITYKADGSANNPENESTSNTHNNIYAKFLYGLTGSEPELSKCNAEYITGYVSVNDVAIDEHGLYLKLGTTDYGSRMQDIAKDFVKTNRYGVINANCSASPGFKDIADILSESEMTEMDKVNWEIAKQFMFCDGSASSIVDWMAAIVWFLCSGDPTGMQVSVVDHLMNCTGIALTANTNVSSVLSGDPIINFDLSDNCQKINLSESFLRIPLNKGKKGGGLRVKRILMNDVGIAGNMDDASLYGNEYLYQKTDGTSSGVATNEPASIREENGLVQPLNVAESQSWYENLIQMDKRQVDGPLGEGLYPGASVGYSRVVVKNIHSAKTNPGFEVKQFYTSFDYPTLVSHTNIEDNEATYSPSKKQDLASYMVNALTAGSVSHIDNINKLWASQGYSVKLNSMNGQPKSGYIYEGDYSDANTLTSAKKIKGQEYAYYEPNEKVKVMKNFESSDYEDEFIGRTQELIMENKSVKNNSTDIITTIPLGVNLTDFFKDLTGDAAIEGLYKAFTGEATIKSAEQLYTFVTNKIIHYPAIPKSVTTYADGVTSYNEYTAFGKHNGKAIRTKSYDEFNDLKLGSSTTVHNGAYTSYTIPASYKYDEMGQKADNEGFVKVSCTKPTSIVDGDPDNYNTKIDLKYAFMTKQPYLNVDMHYIDGEYHVTDVLDKLHPGDLIAIKLETTIKYFHIQDIEDNIVHLYGMHGTCTECDEMDDVNLFVLQSSRTNQLNEIAGSLLTYGDCTNTSNSVTSSTEGNTSITEKSVSGMTRQLNKYTPTLKAGQKIQISMPYQASTKTSTGGTVTASKTMSVEITKTSDSKNTIQVTVNNGGSTPSTYTVSGNSKWSIDKDGKLNIGDKASGASTAILMPSDIDYTYGNNMFFEKYDCYVLQASATTYDDSWNLDDNMEDVFNISSTNPYLTGEKGKWRPKETWVYNSDIIGGNKDESGERIYLNADAATEFYLFDWSSSTEQSNWQKLVSVDYYSPNGDAMQDKNMFDVYSSNKFGYNGAVPYIVAQNADYNSVFFESFENKYSSDAASIMEFEDAYKISDGHSAKTVAHSGSQSLLLNLDKTTGSPATPYTTLPLKTFTLTTQESTDGILVKLWLKTQSDTDPALKLIESNALYDGVAFTKVDRVWDWTLYEAKLTNWKSIAVGGSYTPRIYISGLTATDNIWIDDIRLQPSSSEMSCYVYDPSTLRLLTSFDSQHFGLYYQYNAEGQLTRKIVETEKGKRTVEEKQYNQVASQRPYTSPTIYSIDPSMGAGILGGGTFDMDFGKISLDLSVKTALATETTKIGAFVKTKAYPNQITTDRNTDMLNQFTNAYNYNVNTKSLTNVSQKTAFMKSFYTSYITTKGSAASYTDFTSLVTEYQTQNSTASINTLFK